jgi:hypothetical protein
MTAATHRKARSRPARPAYLTLHGWALGTLVEHGAVIECLDHGHRLDKVDPVEPGSRRGLAEPFSRR